MRLDKFICKSTDFDRTQARDLIAAGQVLVNEDVVTEPSQQVHEHNLIQLNGERLTARASRYFMFHKPSHCLCSHTNGAYPSLWQWLSMPRADDLHLVGRLDADTTGLVLLTDDGRWSFNIMSPTAKCTKVYRVQLRDTVSEAQATLITAQFAAGILLSGETQLTKPATFSLVAPNLALLTLTEGKFHQVKRMLAAVGNKVVGLHREQIGNVRLNIEAGQYRELHPDEIQTLANTGEQL